MRLGSSSGSGSVLPDRATYRPQKRVRQQPVMRTKPLEVLANFRHQAPQLEYLTHPGMKTGDAHALNTRHPDRVDLDSSRKR